MYRALCPDCSEVVVLAERVQVGDRFICGDCGIEIEVLSLYPVDVDYVLEEDWEEDWDDQLDEELEEIE